jgi:hypothetical protein
MATLNHPDKMQLDAYADPNLQTYNPNGVYNRFTNRLATPLLGCKGIQLISTNFVNSTLPLNDNANLMFFYYTSATITNIATLANLKCIRLLPSNYVPYGGFTAYTQNKVFNSGTELVAALNTAASTNGDSVTYNPTWVAGQVTFTYDTTSRRIGILGNGTNYLAPAAADDPNVLDFLRGTTNPNNRPKMNTHNSSNTYATATFQPYIEGRSMNARLGFAMSYYTNGIWWGATNTQRGCATATGVPQLSTSVAVYGDANPVLIGTQNVGIYVSCSTGGGLDPYGKKNLIASVPIQVPPLNVNPYTTNSVETPSLSTPNEIYEITVELLDDYGQPFYQPPNYNTQIALGLFY